MSSLFKFDTLLEMVRYWRLNCISEKIPSIRNISSWNTVSINTFTMWTFFCI